MHSCVIPLNVIVIFKLFHTHTHLCMYTCTCTNAYTHEITDQSIALPNTILYSAHSLQVLDVLCSYFSPPQHTKLLHGLFSATPSSPTILSRLEILKITQSLSTMTVSVIDFWVILLSIFLQVGPVCSGARTTGASQESFGQVSLEVPLLSSPLAHVGPPVMPPCL